MHHLIHRFASILCLGVVLAPLVSYAVPSFARQTNMPCMACHTEYPLLTEFGRQFKLGGYTMSAGQGEMPPLAVMFMAGYTHTAADQAGGAAPGFSANNNFSLSQASIFYAGRLFGPYSDRMFGPDTASVLNKLGVFAQVTYNGVRKTWSWDNLEFRFADSKTVGDRSISYGVYMNNNPTLQDPWNSTPAWGYPFTGSPLAPAPSAGTLIEGALAQQVAGAGAYAMIANTLYLDVAGYRTLGEHFQKSLGVDPAGQTQIAGVAPYGRVALVKPAGAGVWEIGAFAMAADTYPGRDDSEGHDRIVDFGLDTQYQFSSGRSDVTAMATWIHERQDWQASQLLGLTSNGTGQLDDFKATIDYLYDKTYGFVAQYFSKTGTSDDLYYANSGTGSPRSDGIIFQANYLPFNKGGGPDAWPRSNVKISLQYTYYNHFDGARTNYDGAGANARDNNTLYLETWVAF